jgi:hypothetical protein
LEVFHPFICIDAADIEGRKVGLDQRCTLDLSGREGRDAMAAGHCRDRAQPVLLLGLLTTLAITAGTLPARAGRPVLYLLHGCWDTYES